ncbi:MAG TPA: response regulator [Geminocystis sp. M7585_C2015_104]|nr:response regulator [Geminocystis sp. M7585_C2015_104]
MFNLSPAKIPPKPNGKGLLKLLTLRIIWLSSTSILVLFALCAVCLVICKQNIQASLEEASVYAVRQLDFSLVELKSDFLATSTSLSGNIPPRVSQRLHQMRLQNQELIRLSLFDAKGKLLGYSGGKTPIPPPQFSPTIFSSLQQATLDLYISNLKLQDNTPYLEIAAITTDSLGFSTGLLVGQVDLSQLWYNALAQKIGKTGYLYILDDNGVVMAAINPSWLGRQSQHRCPQNPFSLHICQGINGQPVFTIRQPLQFLPWSVVVEQPIMEAIGPSIIPSSVTLIIVVASFVTLLHTIQFLRQRIILPIRLLNQGVNQIQQGNNFTPLQLPQTDELGQLAQTLNMIVDAAKNSLTRLETCVQEKTRELQASCQKLQTLSQKLEFHLQNTPLAVIEWDREMHIVRWSPQAEGVFGYKARETIGKYWLEIPIVHEEDQDLVKTTIHQLLTGLAPRNWCLTRNYTKNKTIIYCQWYNSVLLDAAGNPISILSLVLDVTEEILTKRRLIVAKEKAESTAQAKGNFLAATSHEIRTSMNGIIAMLDFLAEENLSLEQFYYVEIARNSATLLLHLLNDILDFYKMEAGKLTIEKFCFNLPEKLKKIYQFFLPIAEKKGLKLVLNIEGLKDVTLVKGDPYRLTQVLNNLVSNSIKFTEAGEITITSSLEIREGQLLFTTSVRDTGIGIPPEKLTKLFKPFSQVDDSTTRKYGGTGLGLSITKNLCELMGGNIEVTSELGKGSCLTFYVIFEPADMELPADKKEDKNPHPPSFKKREGKIKILLIEDNKVNQLVCRKLLEKIPLEIEVDVADNGKEALTLLQNNPTNPYDLILMDCLMPEMDGYETTRRIRGGEAGNVYLHTPIIAMTANTMKGDEEKCLAAGMNDYVSKPVNQTLFLAKICQWLER